MFLCSANLLCWIAFGGFIRLCPDSWPFENFEENLLRFVSCVINLGPSRFSTVFFSAILSLKDQDADCYPKIRLVSSETAHPGYLKNLVAARWNRFQRSISTSVVSLKLFEMVSTIHNLSARARRSLTSISLSKESREHRLTLGVLLYFCCHCPVERGDVCKLGYEPLNHRLPRQVSRSRKTPSFQKTKPCT